MTIPDPRAPLLGDVSPFEVDFVIPRIGVDLPFGIDPFLLYKSRDPGFRELHRQLIRAFNAGIEFVRLQKLDRARRLFSFPEVKEIGLGYTRGGKRGSGVGTHLSGLILDTLSHSPALLERGVKHVEEMQLLSTGIGADRVSDIAANVLKSFLLEYTQKQAEIWGLPVTPGVPIRQVLDVDSLEWNDGYFDLPISPFDGSPILLVPRRIVRVLPWINYDDFVRGEFKAYLEARRAERRTDVGGESGHTHLVGATHGKAHVVSVTRSDLALVDRYVQSRERAAADARPTLDYLADEDACREAEVLKAKLAAVESGRPQAATYQHLVLEILNFLFNPELIDGEPEVRTVEGTERRDIVFTNDSDETFWDYLRTEHGSILIMFETKNTDDLDASAFNQTATYLGDRLGTLAVIVTRLPFSDAMHRKAFSIWNDSAPRRKVILGLSDLDLRELLDLRCRDASPSRWMQRHYRAFRTAVQ